MEAFIATVLKKIAVDLLTDPEKLVKAIFWFVILPIFAFLVIFTIPIIIVSHIPAILVDGGVSPELTQEQLKVVALYQDAPVSLDKSNLEWIEQKKEEYSWCDDIKVTYNFSMVWQDLMAIDSVKLKQDFKKANKSDIMKLANKFIVKSCKTEEYKVKVKHTRKIRDKDGNVIDTEVYYTEETRTRAIIKITSKSFSEVLNTLGFSSEEKEAATRIYNTIINADVEGNLNIYDDIDLSQLQEYPAGNAKIPYYNQTDRRWGAESYGNSTIASGGCGPTSLAMVVAGLTGNRSITPKTTANWSEENGCRAEGAGSYWSLMTAGGKAFGLKVEAVSRANPNKIVQALSKGYPVIAAMGRGHFTKGGHFIVLRGVMDDGKIVVYDKASVSGSKIEWYVGIILNESSTNNGIYGSPFWIFKP